MGLLRIVSLVVFANFDTTYRTAPDWSVKSLTQTNFNLFFLDSSELKNFLLILSVLSFLPDCLCLCFKDIISHLFNNDAAFSII